MSYPCAECGYQIDLTRWSRAKVAMRGLWPGNVETGVATCPMCGYDSYRAESSFGRVDAAADFDMRLTSVGRYRCPPIASSVRDVVYLIHPLPVDGSFHAQALSLLAARYDPATTFLVAEERFNIPMESYAAGWEVPDDLAGHRSGPYANLMVEWAVSNYAFTHLGRPKVETMWPSYFRSNFDYIGAVSDEELFRGWSYDFRRRLPIEIKVNQ